MQHEQRTEGWREDRAGRLTASVFGDALAFRKDGLPMASREALMNRMLVEILTGTPKPEIDAASLRWGREQEPLARSAYEIETGNIVEESPFVLMGGHPYIGASPDGLIRLDGGLEMKCPKDSGVHFSTVMTGEMPDEHIPQVQGGMMVTGRSWWDFVSYDPRMPEPMRFFCKRIYRDDSYIYKTLLPGLQDFWTELMQRLVFVSARFGIDPANLPEHVADMWPKPVAPVAPVAANAACIIVDDFDIAA